MLFERRYTVVIILSIAQILNAQVEMFHKEFEEVVVPYNPPVGVTIHFFCDYPGKITQFWWGFTASGWRDLHIRYTLPSGVYFEQVAGKPWVKTDSVIGEPFNGPWELTLLETQAGPSHKVTTHFDAVVQRNADPNLPVVGIDAPELIEVDDIMLNWLRKNDFEAATIAIMKDRRLVYKKGYGWQDYDRTQPILPDAIMRLASNTKPITRRGIQQLIEDGLLNPEERVYDLLAIPPWSDIKDRNIFDITVQHLIDHKSGLRKDAPGTGKLGGILGLERPATLAETIAYMWTQDLLFKPGTKSQYSNLGYQILGHIIEVVSGQSYEQFIQENIAIPLGIKSFTVANNHAHEALNQEIWYAGERYSYLEIDMDQSLEQVPQPYAKDMKTRPGAGSLVSSAEDYCRFLNAYFHTGRAKPLDLRGWQWSYTFFGSLPGTLTITRDTVKSDGSSLAYVVLVNERINGKKNLQNDLVALLDGFLFKNSLWPELDLFQETDLEQENLL